ncbi:uncharacterized protein LTR77_009535 [Saxophila tyrrhenica]|uniref:Carboxylic ester hydrolase n=1 Tax=Saxophila tyrrhenica TaxID=1690608 RepID=A0AAV9NXW9_9PEZI|nr:hypothetical protein LTR77_009535 [Saxophila tyrrhenica]
MRPSSSLVTPLFAVAAIAAAVPHEHCPLAQTRNGTYEGVYSPEYDQDFFLGMPFAQPPVNDLRFRNPQSLNTSWHGSQPAVEYSPACVGYGSSQMGYEISEDCLYLNVIRPAGVGPKQKLPILVWIHGGGFVQGSGVDLRYNMSFIVQQSQQMGQPIMAVTLNYRLSAFGFLQGYDEQDASAGGNWGVRDQRLALHWIQENVDAFGGDPDKVTIWGQSAGAGSVGLQITAYDGRDDGLFRSAIMDSGNPIFYGDMKQNYEPIYQNFTRQAGCGNSTDGLQCLRDLPFDALNDVLNTTEFSGAWTPQIDGDIIARYSSDQVADGAFVKVPIIDGTNSDEGTSFAPEGLNTTKQFREALISDEGMNATFARAILNAYPLFSPDNDLANLGPIDFVPLAYPYGTQWRRTTTYYTDSRFEANRRLTCQTWTFYGIPAYCYRFNAIPSWAGPYDGATHFVEVAFAMKNLLGVGYPPVRSPPFQGLSKGYFELATLMSGDWVSFVAHGNPNKWDRAGVMASLQKRVPHWDKYADAVFQYEGNSTLRMRKDDWRQEGIDLINSANKEVYGR